MPNEVKASETTRTKYCMHCGSLIDYDCIICPHCGKQVAELQRSADPIVINNRVSSKSVSTVRVRRHHSFIFDAIMTICTGGLWLIWVIIRTIFGW